MNGIPEKLVERYNHLGSYSADKISFAGSSTQSAIHYRDELSKLHSQAGASLAAYVHLPFCPVRCLNCERNSTITQDPGVIDEYLDNLNTEVGLISEYIGSNIHLKQLHIGGGTPNYLSEPQLAHLMDIMHEHFEIDQETETSIEAHPKRASKIQLDLLQGLGIKRINFGVRDVNIDVQNAIGRVHSFEMLQDVFETARQAGFETISTDLMYGLPGQTLESIKDTINKITVLAPDRIDCFSYVRRTTYLPHQIAIDTATIPTRIEKLEIFNEIVEGLSGAGYSWIGLECFAKQDSPLVHAKNNKQLRRNWIGYTLNPAKNLIGFGVNASSEINGLCVQNSVDLKNWTDSLQQKTLPIQGGLRLDNEDLEKRDKIIELACNPDLTRQHSVISEITPVYLDIAQVQVKQLTQQGT